MVVCDGNDSGVGDGDYVNENNSVDEGRGDGDQEYGDGDAAVSEL